jgi:hypothetical protein
VTAGGWEEVDELMNSLGQLNIPVGLMYDPRALPNVANWKLNLDPAQRTNGAAIVNVWMTQGWFNNMMYITGQHAVNASAAVLDMLADDGRYPAGGWQGGRHWQTRCSFQSAHCPGDPGGGPLLGGGWFVSNVAAELDSYDEYYFDPATNTLSVFYNASSDAAGSPFAPPPPGLVLMAPQLEVFFNLSAGAADVTIDGLGFRDQRFSYMDPWVVPSGGDWGLRPAGAVNFVDTERCTLSGALFSRTDGNAVFIGGRNRNVSVLDSEFVWLGMNAVASLGKTEQDDATGGEQPWGTLLSGLVARELALYEKQSSAFFVGRTPLSRLEASLFYNGPRAMVNVNDHLGGANNFTTSVMFVFSGQLHALRKKRPAREHPPPPPPHTHPPPHPLTLPNRFNTCRESGDHGAMNSCSLPGVTVNPPAQAPHSEPHAPYRTRGPHAVSLKHRHGGGRRNVRPRTVGNLWYVYHCKLWVVAGVRQRRRCKSPRAPQKTNKPPIPT